MGSPFLEGPRNVVGVDAPGAAVGSFRGAWASGRPCLHEACQTVGNMGKAKKAVQEDNFSFVVELKSVLALKPDQRVKWLGKACKAVAEGEASVKHLFDVLTSKKLVHGVPPKPGQKMLRILKEHLYLFSEKQQRFLQEESSLVQTFDKEDSEEERVAARSEKQAPAADAGLRMEEMMARCRDFVRAQASGFEDRTREVEEKERIENEKARLAEEEKRRREWEIIAEWHKPLEAWEAACMANQDERYERVQRLIVEAAEDAKKAETEREARRGEAKARKRHKPSNSSDEPEAFRRDRTRSKKAKRRSSRSRSRKSRSRRRRRSPDESDKKRRKAKSTREKQSEEHAQAELKAKEVQKLLSQASSNAMQQAYDPLIEPDVRTVTNRAAADAATAALSSTLAGLLKGDR